MTENTNEQNWSDKTLLIVEDDRISISFIKELLAPTGINIIEALSGEKAVEKMQIEEIDLVLMDIQLPGINGYQTTQRIKAINHTIPVIAQTAYAMQEDQEKAMEAGCDDYISKPIEIDGLLAIMKDFLQEGKA